MATVGHVLLLILFNPHALPELDTCQSAARDSLHCTQPDSLWQLWCLGFPVSRNYPGLSGTTFLASLALLNQSLTPFVCWCLKQAITLLSQSSVGKAFPILRAAVDCVLSWLFGQMWNKFAHIEKPCPSDQGLLNEQGPGHCSHFEQIEEMISFSRVMLGLSIQPKIPRETAERARVTARSSLNRSPSPQPNQY